MTKKGRNKKERNKKRIVISCFWYTQVYIRIHVFIYTKRRKKDDTVSSYSYLQHLLLIASSLRSFFLRAICEAYTYTFSSNRTMRGKARKTLCKAFFLRERPIPRSDFFLPLSFLFLLSLLFDAFRFERKFERGSIEKTSNVKEKCVISKIVYMCVCVRERERKR